MTDTSTTLKNSYNGNDSATSFDYQFKIYDENELIVIKTNNDGVDETLTLNTDYTVNNVGENNGGSVTYPISGSPLSANETLTLYPSYPLTQTIEFTNQDKAYFELFEEGLDRANLKIKMLQEQLDRAVKVDVTSEATPDDYITSVQNAASNAASYASSAQSAANSINMPDTILMQGQCRLEYESATAIKLAPHNGNTLILIDSSNVWQNIEINSAGVTFSDTASLTADTLYYIYAFLDNGALTLKADTTAPTTESATGFKILASDKSICVGMIYLNASKQLDNENMVSSYFNRRPKTNRVELSSDATTTSTSYIEASTELRCPFLLWDDSEALAQLNCMQYTGAASITGELFLTLDGTTASDRFGALYKQMNDGYAAPKMTSIIEPIRGRAEGYHYASVVYATTHPSYAITINGSSGRFSNLNITVMG
jgi:hypothetical protein